MTLDYTWQKLYEAVYGLATGDGPLVDRLEGALSYLVTLTEQDFPDELRPFFVQIVAAMTWKDGQGGEGAIRASVRMLEGHQARRLAEAIVGLYGKVSGKLGTDVP